MPDDRQPWFVVVDPQRIFADPTSDWAAPRFGEIVEPVRALASAHAGRTLVTRWLPGADRAGSWRAYFDRWQFADRPDEDPLLDLVPQAEGLTERPTIDVSTFGKWSPALQSVVGHHAHLVLAGVATDCCVTVLPDPNGPGIAAAPPMTRGNSTSRMRIPVRNGRLGSSLRATGRGARTGQ